MELEFNESQQILRKSARDFFEKEFPKTLVRQMEEVPTSFNPEIWKKMSELGWPGLVVPEKYGGADGGFLDLFVLLEEMGRACCISPFFSTVMCTYAIMDAGSEAQKSKLLPQLARGETIMAPAWTEISASYDTAGIETTARAEPGAYTISGTKMFVHDANVADYLLCVTRLAERKAPENIALFLVETRSNGVKTVPLPSIADDNQNEVVFDSVAVNKDAMLGGPDKTPAILTRLLERSAVAKCAEMIGGGDWTIEQSLTYAKQRVQFGKPIGSLQVIQHYLAEMWSEVNIARMLVYNAAWEIDRGLPCRKEAAMAKAMMSEVYLRCTRMGVQIHGGIGTTRDHDMGLYYRRARQAVALFGSPDFWREKVAVEMQL